MRAGRHILAYLPVNLATILVAFGGLAILTRLLEPAEYGRYALAMITMLFVHMSLFTWLEAAVARFQARADANRDETTFLRTLYGAALLVGTAGVGAAVALVWALPLDAAMRNVLTAALVTTGMQLALNLGFEAHKASHRIGRYSLLYSSHQTMSFVIGIFVILLTPLREVGPFVGIGVSAVVVGSIDLPFMLKRLRGGVVETARLKEYFAYGMPISLSLVLAYALNSADMYIITAYLGEAAAGQYSAGYNLSNRALEVLFIWIAMAMTPLAVTAFENEGEVASVDVMRGFGAALAWLALPGAVGLMLVAEPLGGFVLGEGIREGAVGVMPWIAGAAVLNGSLTYYVQRAFMLSGRTGDFAWILIGPVIMNIGLNIALVPSLGLFGAVLATILSYAMGVVLAVIVARKHYPLPLPFRAVGEVLLCCMAMAAAVIALPAAVETLPSIVELLVKAGVGGAVYLSMSVLINAADCRGVVKSVLARFRPEPVLEAAE